MITPAPRPGIMEITPYVPGKSARQKEARAIKLSSNENPYGPNLRGVEAYREATASLHRYPDGGASALREAIGAAHGLDPSRIVCGAGSDELIGLLTHAYAGPGDEVLYSAHGFLMYRIYTLAAGAMPIAAPEKSLCADVDALLSRVSNKTRIVYLANPNNPTGSYLPAAELARLRAGLPELVILAIDAAYAEYVTDEDCPDGRALVEAGGNTVMLRTFSKIYGLPALRLGWMYGPSPIVDVMHRVRSPFNVSSPAQAAGVAAVHDPAWVKEHRRLNAEQRDWLARELERLGMKPYPSAGNFLLAECGNAERAARIVAALAERNIFIRDVNTYKLPTCVRITVGRPEDNAALVEALREAT